ncbi:MAG TPA: hypothetical protein VKY74_08955, partial [Chloroflexia bacterium]|nr:hypothetical protein [Chloroflexia bacterium]
MQHPARWVYTLVLLLTLLLLGAGYAPGRAASAPPAGAQSLPATPLPCGAPPGWSPVSPYPFPSFASAVGTLGGYLYAFGGPGAPNGESFKYDPLADLWIPIAPMPAYRSEHRAVSDGTYIYLLNGNDGSTHPPTLWRYDPAGNTYTILAPPPVGSVVHAAAYLNGKIYRIAGAGLNSVDVYDIASNTWAPPGTIANYPLVAYRLQAVVAGGYIYTAGGVGYSQAYRYDPAGNTWDDAAVTDLPGDRNSYATTILNGRWLIAGGFINNNTVRTNTVLALDLANPAGPWVLLPAMPQPLDYF